MKNVAETAWNFKPINLPLRLDSWKLQAISTNHFDAENFTSHPSPYQRKELTNFSYLPTQLSQWAFRTLTSDSKTKKYKNWKKQSSTKFTITTLPSSKTISSSTPLSKKPTVNTTSSSNSCPVRARHRLISNNKKTNYQILHKTINKNSRIKSSPLRSETNREPSALKTLWGSTPSATLLSRLCPFSKQLQTLMRSNKQWSRASQWARTSNQLQFLK